MKVVEFQSSEKGQHLLKVDVHEVVTVRRMSATACCLILSSGCYVGINGTYKVVCKKLGTPWAE